jgi:hypothetical protein
MRTLDTKQEEVLTSRFWFHVSKIDGFRAFDLNFLGKLKAKKAVFGNHHPLS